MGACVGWGKEGEGGEGDGGKGSVGDGRDQEGILYGMSALWAYVLAQLMSHPGGHTPTSKMEYVWNIYGIFK